MQCQLVTLNEQGPCSVCWFEVNGSLSLLSPSSEYFQSWSVEAQTNEIQLMSLDWLNYIYQYRSSSSIHPLSYAPFFRKFLAPIYVSTSWRLAKQYACELEPCTPAAWIAFGPPLSTTSQVSAGSKCHLHIPYEVIHLPLSFSAAFLLFWVLGTLMRPFLLLSPHQPRLFFVFSRSFCYIARTE